MAFRELINRLCGEVPGVKPPQARVVINDALGKIYDETDWSFQSLPGGWLAPGLVASTGTVTVTPGSASVVGDATAAAAWLALGAATLKTLQFRDPSYALYSIVNFDGVNTLTLDRVWMEPTSGAGHSYYIYQAYFPVPVADFRKFVEIRDTTNSAPVSFTELSQDDLAYLDPQRVQFGPGVPTFAVPVGADQRAGSATLNYPMYELWPHVLSRQPYSFTYNRRGPMLAAMTDLVPYPITEEVVSWRAKEVVYLWKEAQKGEQVQRGSGADWKFLAQAAAAEYMSVLKQVRAVDANLHRQFVTRQYDRSAGSDGYSTNRNGQLNVGRFGR